MGLNNVSVYDVSVVIVSWNACDLLRDCLKSIFDQTSQINFEVIVVDNSSSDASVEMVRHEFPQVKLVAEEVNHGFAGANNVGIIQSRGRYVLLLNPDTVILDDAIGRSLNWIVSHPDVAVLGCQVFENETTIQQTCFAHPGLFNLLLDLTGITSRFGNSRVLGRSVLGGWDRQTERDVPVVSGMFMLIPRKAIDEVGLMDEQFFVYSEEADLCRRFWNAGWRCVFSPVAKIIHRDGGGKSTSQVSVKMYVQLQKSNQLYIKKHCGIVGWLVGKIIYIIAMGLRVMIHGTRCCFTKSISARHQLRQSLMALKFHFLGDNSNGNQNIKAHQMEKK